MRSSVVSVIWCLLLSCTLVAMATADVARAGSDADARDGVSHESLGSPEEPSNRLPRIQERGSQKDSLFPVSPLGWLHDGTDQAKQDLYDASGLKLGFTFTHLFQGLSDALPDKDKWGTASATNFLGSWDLINRGEPTLGQAVFHAQARWQYGDIVAPEDLGFVNLASAIGTADTFAEYTPTFVLRNLYWRQGSPEAGWGYRVGKITPDALLSSSAHLDSETTFLPSGSVSSLAIAFPDSGLGGVGAWYINDRVTLVGLVSDANADRFNFGDIGEGDLYKAAELHVKIAPRTPKAGYSKLTLWHNDGTKDGLPINASLGRAGWGVFVKHEQELTDDGRVIGIVRYGKSFNDSAFYDQQAGAHLLLNEPRLLARLKNDLIGVAFNWAQADLTDARNEYSVEAFYRFPIFPHVDTTLSYQSVINPALTRDLDHASVFSLRIRTTF